MLTCARCGTFACEVCKSSSDSLLCGECGERFAAVRIDVVDTLQRSFQVMVQHPRAMAVFAATSVAFGLVSLPVVQSMREAQLASPADPMGVLGRMLPAYLGLMVAATVYSATAYSVLIRFLGDALLGERRPVGAIIRDGLRRSLSMLGLSLLAGAGLTIGFALCIAPGVFLAVVLSIAAPAVVLHPAGPLEAMSLSFQRTVGHRPNIFLLMLLGGLILVGASVTSGLLSLLTQSLGLTGAVLSTIVGNTVNALGFTLIMSMLVIVYLRLTGRWIPSAAT